MDQVLAFSPFRGRGLFVLLALVAAQRLLELLLSRRHEIYLRGRAAPRRSAPTTIHSLSRSIPVAGGAGAVGGVHAAGAEPGIDGRLFAAAAAARLDHRQPGAILDHAHYHLAGRAAGAPRALPVHAPSELCAGGPGDRDPAIGRGRLAVAVMFSILNALILRVRIRLENQALDLRP